MKPTTAIFSIFATIAVVILAAGFFTFLYGLLVIPRINKNVYCFRSVSRSCFLGSTICYDYPDSCTTPPLWYPAP